MWLHSVARRAWRSTRATTRSRVQRARQRLEHERLVVAEAHDADTLARQPPSSHSITPPSWTWPPPVA